MRPQNRFATPRAAGAPRRRGGFTLVELLVVVGIIAVLAALVLTVRSRASDQARSAQCMNNLRQIGLAMTLYAQSNDQAFPFGAPAAAPDHRKEDWIAFRAGEEPGPTGLSAYVNRSAIAPYAKLKSDAFIAMMRCPADDVGNHQPRGTTFPYRFSYSMNYAMTSEPAYGKAANRGATPRVTSINRPAEKILVAEENERTINDGLWEAGRYEDLGNRSSAWNVTSDYLSVRHDTRQAEHVDPQGFGGFLLDPSKRGNVLFVDGHTEFVSRLYAHSAAHLLVSDEGLGVPKVR